MEHTSIVTAVTPGQPGLPRAMVLTVYFALSPAIGLGCHRHPPDTSGELDASVEASGPRDFAVRDWVLSSSAPVASTASRPAFRDDREPPLRWSRTARDIEVIWGGCEAEYFCKRGWTGFEDLR